MEFHSHERSLFLYLASKQSLMISQISPLSVSYNASQSLIALPSPDTVCDTVSRPLPHHPLDLPSSATQASPGRFPLSHIPSECHALRPTPKQVRLRIYSSSTS